MALIMKNQPNPSTWFGIIYGQSGIGKTTAAIQLGMVLADTENSSSRYECQRADVDNMQKLYAVLREAYEDNDIKGVCLDTLDAIEPWLIAEVIQEGRAEFGDKIKDLLSFGYGGGYARLLDKYVKLCTALEKIAQKKPVLVLVHEQMKPVEDPIAASYDRASLAIYNKAAKHFVSKADFVLYARHEFAINEGKVVNKKRRVCYSQDGVSYAAKTRLKMPPAFELSELARVLENTTQSSAQNSAKNSAE